MFTVCEISVYGVRVAIFSSYALHIFGTPEPTTEIKTASKSEQKW
jgi:hypothetical protein